MIFAARACAAAAALTAGVALAGYALDILTLATVSPGLRGMSPLTATGILALAFGAITATRGAPRFSGVGIAVAMAVSVAVMAAHGAFGHDALSPWLGAELFRLSPERVGQTSLATALAIAAVAFALAIRRKAPVIADLTAGLALILSSTALLGYLYGVGDLYRFALFNSMGLNTAVALALLALAALFVESDTGAAAILGSEDAAGAATRRQLCFTLLPVAAGFVLLKATHAERLGPAFAMALLVIITVAPLVILVLRDGRVLQTLDRERRAKLAIQERLTAEMGEKLEAQAAALAHEGEERTKAEAAMYRAQRMEAVGQLTGGIAHDFNNLLMAIRGNLELLGHRLPGGEDRLRRYLDNATAATDKGAKITAQLLAFSRSQRLDIRPVELDPVLMASRELIGNALGPDISLNLTLGTAGAWARTDPDQLELAILNLAVNARDAMPEGGVIRIESSACEPLLASEHDQTKYVAVWVIDTGMGMTEEVSAQAVEPFFTTKELGKGTGLGLAQVYGFVRQCGGDLRIISKLGRGTTVEMLLPCAEPVAAVESKRPRANAADSIGTAKGRQVLVIDDDDGVRAVIVDALRSAGFVVIEASDGESGLALLDRTSPAAAVIDFLMPGMNGAEVARVAQQRRPGLPIVFVSGYSDTVALDGIAGAVVLRKPFDMAGLDRALASVLQ